jgi:GWxTD domain-containing protein
LNLPCEEKLSETHKEWLELVSPIITKIEKEVFSNLKTEQDRDKFIQLFWKRRDPLPDTEENEFYKEYMKRVRFSDLNFGRGAVKRGSQTERGYFYLLLGPPLERQLYTTQSQVWPMELWYYKGDPKYGLPPYFYLLFYQPRGIGEYRLYSPVGEGPEKLVIQCHLDLYPRGKYPGYGLPFIRYPYL